MFKYDWSRFDAKLGLIFMVGALLVFNLSSRLDFALYAAGISALLAWLADIMLPHDWLMLVAMGIVTFVGYMMLLRGAHAFMVAWCLVYWYLLVPLFLGEKGLGPVVLGHAVGVSLVFVLNLLKPVWARASGGTAAEIELIEASDEERPPVGMVVRYSSIVSVSIVMGVAAGARWLTSDPTLIANATLNVISPSLEQTWRNGLERVILGTLGIVGGFYFGWFFPSQWVGLLVTAV